MTRVTTSLSVWALTLACATAPRSTASSIQGIDGIWINDTSEFPSQVVNDGDGFEYYSKAWGRMWKGTRQVVSSWTDSSGDRWYRTYDTATSNSCGANAYSFVCSPVGAKWQLLLKVSDAGKTLEFVFARVDEFSAEGFPTDINPDISDLALAANHRVLTRKQ